MLTQYFVWFLILRALVGVGEASYCSIAPSIIADLFTDNARTVAIAAFYFAIPVGGYYMSSLVTVPPPLNLGALSEADVRQSQIPLRYNSASETGSRAGLRAAGELVADLVSDLSQTGSSYLDMSR